MGHKENEKRKRSINISDDDSRSISISLDKSKKKKNISDTYTSKERTNVGKNGKARSSISKHRNKNRKDRSVSSDRSMTSHESRDKANTPSSSEESSDTESSKTSSSGETSDTENSKTSSSDESSNTSDSGSDSESDGSSSNSSTSSSVLEKKKGKEVEKEIDDNKKAKYEAHIYDSKEMIRLTINILQNYNFINNLKVLYKKLDNKKKISLESIKDLRLKKKLRHLFRAWKLEKKDEFYRKPSSFKESIYDIFSGLYYYFLSQIDIEKLKYNINKRKSDLLKQKENTHKEVDNINENYKYGYDSDQNNDNVNYSHINLFSEEEKAQYINYINSQNEKAKGLRELHEEGHFKNSKEQYKKFLEKHQTVDLWGKSEQEQKFLLNSKQSNNERKTFDRERDLCTNRFIKKDSYNKLIKNTKEHVDGKFHKTSDQVI
ncbi:conserved protein, unknown function [Plasmodium chabaudi chabaudi]|uniref:Uncharacterized protein n=1 Tax=Plasmodium chabaudi chabaudi TaxID=31271 RepID=A0A4V0KD52_PLACU|nr:conserved protein, unknown function [Plasmodium chabaudi chabaudi]VTZ70907.1 conserved protein, unknown function [Plasmodium chabaudi chabaudi]|eukprot:XP_745886.2 conserved Plasmodium protein, unknown function [Plasmodium chabaudi chabaudi]